MKSSKLIKFARATVMACCVALPMAAAHAVEVAPLAAAEQAEIQVNLNQASAEELAESLVGVGPAKAEAIVAHRESNGPFQSVEDITSVRGIGPTLLEKNRTRLAL